MKISARKEGEPFRHFWSFCVGAGRANEGLRAAWQKQLKMAVDNCGFQYIRFHGLFADDMFVYRVRDGKEYFNWQYIDAVFDGLLQAGIRPFVELGFCPEAMASGEATQFWWKTNVTPPKDYGTWARLIEHFINHILLRYGKEEVHKWYFEVWNEPNLNAFWRGGKQKYFELYKVTVETIKKIDGNLRVGGPATSNFVPDGRFDGDTEDTSLVTTFSPEADQKEWKAVWLADFLKYCKENDLPVDFISTHPYPTDFGFDGEGSWRGHSRGIDSTRTDLQWLRNFVDGSCYRDAEIHLTEWNSSPVSNDRSHDFLPVASFVMKCNLESTGLVDSLAFWTFTDIFEECGAGLSVFHGGFGLINYQGIVKPTFHAYRFMNELGDILLFREEGCVVTKHSGNDRICAAMYNYCSEEVPSAVPIARNETYGLAEEIESSGSCRQFSLHLKDLPENAKFVLEIVDREHGNAIHAFWQLGCPEPPSGEETEILKRAAAGTVMKILSADGNGNLDLDIVLQPWSIASLRQL